MTSDEREIRDICKDKNEILIRKSTQQMCPTYNVLLCLSLDGDMQ